MAHQFDISPFHPGEESVQKRTGALELSLKLGRAWHSRAVPKTAATFFAGQQLLYLSSINKDGRLWASFVVGARGFLQSTTPTTFAAMPCYRSPSDPAELNVGSHIGTTGIVLETRERWRLNGTIANNDQDKLAISVEAVFSGCPKYIQAREVEVIEERLEEVTQISREQVSSGHSKLGAEQEALITRADTLFLASCYEGPLEQSKGVQGCDISHRGGSPGFVHVKDSSMLTFADYVGNYTFTTLGNIEADPRASILFLDFSCGDVLQLSGRCHILWEDRSLPGAQRLLAFGTEEWVHTRHAIPLGPAGPVKWSPYNPLPSCQYSEDIEKDRLRQLHNNYVDTSPYFIARCLGVTEESPDVKTFTFEGSESATPLKSGNAFCDPGQFGSFDFPDIKDGETLNRTWTISSPQDEMRTGGTSSGCVFAVTIKKIGIVSTWMFNNMQPGRTIHFRGVDGDFTLDRRVPEPSSAGVLFIAGGIGITPMRVLFQDSISKGIRSSLLYSVRTEEDAVFLRQLQKVTSQTELASLAVTVTSKPAKRIAEAGIHDSISPNLRQGRIDVAMIQEVCPDFLNRDVFLCGPVEMMQAVQNMLLGLGLPAERLHQEIFTF